MSSASPAAFSDPTRSQKNSSSGRRTRRWKAALYPSQSVYDWIVIALIALAPWLGVWLFGGVRLWSIGPLMAVVFLATALCALRYLRVRNGLTGRAPPGFLMLAIFVVYGFLLIPRAAVPYDAFVESLKVASYLCAYWVWSELAGWQGRWRWVIAGFMLVVTVMAWYAIIQHVHGSRGVLNLIRPTDYGMRASGAYFCPNHFANLLDMTVPFALAVAMAPAAGIPLRLLAGYTVLVALPPLYLTQSRSGWIGVLVGLVVTISLLGLRRSFWRFLALAIIASVGLAAVGSLVWMFSPMVQERVAQALAGNVRLQLWHDTWVMISERPWLGWGPYAYRWVYPHFWHFMTVYFDPRYAHNDYLHTWAEYGAVGLMLLVGAVAVGAGRLLRSLRRVEPDRGAYLIAGFLGALAATAAHAGFDYNFHIYGNVQMLIMMAGVVAGVLHHANGAIVPDLIRHRWIASSALVALLLMAFSIRAVATYAFSLRADTDSKAFKLEEAQKGYERALRIEPRNWEARLGLGHLWYGQAFWNRDPETRAQQIQQAESAYQAVQQMNPWETESRFGQSRILMLQGNDEQALQVLQQLVDRMPHHRDYLNQLGLQLRRMGRNQEALAAFQRSRALGSNELAERNIQALTRKLAGSTGATTP